MSGTAQRPRLPPRGVYAITADLELGVETLAAQVEAAIEGGAVIVQYRRKSIDRALALAEVRALQRVCAANHTRLIVNDDLELALEAGADGVHLGRDDGHWEALAADPDRRLLLGISCYADLSRAQRAAALGADYVALGSFFPSDTKPEASACPLEILREARSSLRVPIVAIGGITPENGGSLVRAGADFLAVISGIFAQPSIESAAARYASLFGEQHV